MSWKAKTRGPAATGRGLFFSPWIVEATFRVQTNLPSPGELVYFDEAATDASVNAGKSPGDLDYTLANVRAVEDTAISTESREFGKFGIALDSAIDDKPLRVMISGRVQVLLAAGITPVQGLIALASQKNLQLYTGVAINTSAKILGMPEATSVADPLLTWINFDGWNGFGVHHRSV